MGIQSVTSLIASLAIGLMLPSTAARADFLGFLAGDTIDDSLMTIDAMLTRHREALDADVKGYITRFEDLEEKVFVDIHEVREAVKQDILDLEKKIILDIRETLWEAECTTERALNVTLQDALSKAIAQFRTEFPNIDVNVFGLTIAQIATSDNPSSVPIPSPDIVYYEFKKASLNSMESYYQDVGEGAPAYKIYSTLLSVSQMARRTACFFPGNESTVERFIREHYWFASQAALWDRVVSVRYSN